MNRVILWIGALGAALTVCAQKQPCEELTKVSLPNVTITKATSVPAGPFSMPGGRAGATQVTVPAFCRVAATVWPEVKFELWMPANWNRKLLAVGNGGLAGNIQY